MYQKHSANAVQRLKNHPDCILRHDHMHPSPLIRVHHEGCMKSNDRATLIAATAAAAACQSRTDTASQLSGKTCPHPITLSISML